MTSMQQIDSWMDYILSLEDSASERDGYSSTETVNQDSLHEEEYDRSIWHVDEDRLRMGAVIGRGFGGIVFKCILTRPGGFERVVAVKSPQEDRSFAQCESLKGEFNVLKILDHENIIKLIGYNEEAHLLIIEYMPMGSLMSCIHNLSRSEDLAGMPVRKYALDIANGMVYLERMKIVHMDLALRNILLESHTEVKICDFGLAKALGDADHFSIEGECALPLGRYSPETITEMKFTSKSDVWSYGILLWEIYNLGASPTFQCAYSDLAEYLKCHRLVRPRGCPRDMYELMLACWKLDPRERISFEQIGRTLELTLREATTSAY